MKTNWSELTESQIKAVGCKRKPPERKLKGEWLDGLVRNTEIEGVPLLWRLPERANLSF